MASQSSFVRILSLTRVGQYGASLLSQTECFIQLTKRKQPCIARDIRSVKFESEFAVELDTKCAFSPVTHWMPLSKWQITTESQGLRACIMPSRTIHLGNPRSRAYRPSYGGPRPAGATLPCRTEPLASRQCGPASAMAARRAFRVVFPLLLVGEVVGFVSSVLQPLVVLVERETINGYDRMNNGNENVLGEEANAVRLRRCWRCN